MRLLFLGLLLSLGALAQATDLSCTTKTGSAEIAEQFEIKTDVPKHLRGATIIVRKADGTESAVPAERFKVVPRKQQFIVTKVETKSEVTCLSDARNKNRVSLLGGYGSRNGLDTKRSGSTLEVESRSGLVGGAQYQRSLSKRFSVGIQGQTNGTGSLLLGVDF